VADNRDPIISSIAYGRQFDHASSLKATGGDHAGYESIEEPMTLHGDMGAIARIGHIPVAMLFSAESTV